MLPAFEMSVVGRRKGCGHSQTACAGGAGLVEGGLDVKGGELIGFWRKLEGLEKKNWMNYGEMAQSASGVMT